MPRPKARASKPNHIVDHGISHGLAWRLEFNPNDREYLVLVEDEFQPVFFRSASAAREHAKDVCFAIASQRADARVRRCELCGEEAAGEYCSDCQVLAWQEAA